MSDIGYAAYSIWAPPESPWSAWVKPVLFAHAAGRPNLTADPPVQPVHVPPAIQTDGSTAILINLPGERSVLAGLEVAHRGFRPVPLFNGCPGPSPVVPVKGILDCLLDSADALAACTLHADAPPAFLLDSRRKGVVKPPPGSFDNRWMVFPQDFPSAAALASLGINRALLITDHDGPIDEDLAHVLHRWQLAGIAIARLSVHGDRPSQVTVSKPRGYGLWFQAMMARLGFKRNAAGGFGSVVPSPSSSSGYHAGFG